MNPISSVSAGVISATARFDQASVNVVKAANGVGSTDLSTAIVDQVTAKAAADASLKAWSVADQMTKATLNILV